MGTTSAMASAGAPIRTDGRLSTIHTSPATKDPMRMQWDQEQSVIVGPEAYDMLIGTARELVKSVF